MFLGTRKQKYMTCFVTRIHWFLKKILYEVYMKLVTNNAKLLNAINYTGSFKYMSMSVLEKNKQKNCHVGWLNAGSCNCSCARSWPAKMLTQNGKNTTNYIDSLDWQSIYLESSNYSVENRTVHLQCSVVTFHYKISHMGWLNSFVS